jgi:hypothetical protein
MTQSPQTGQGMRGRAQLSWEPGLEDEEEAMDLEGVSIKHARCSVSYTERIPCPGRISTTPSRFVSGLALAYK